MDTKGSAAVLAIKRSAGVASEVNLRNPLHVRQGSNLVQPFFETKADITRSTKQGISGPQKGLVSPNFFFRKSSFPHMSYTTIYSDSLLLAKSSRLG